ncbi:methionine ABC transporter ATP-binding protein [Selenihalanaerobacter shriftii]|uniref:D-methionine transport system ATP-binding protein n=1 Tax=Selenihalanaerobacter shriftii TaxID=142842 RepID=A0A1T4JV59_9FIRM|nr:methionine ABC transporter ATP-binding protein [Selenihalanaerobacter shriftii]SJZ34041.1 D-methionine transport system ATP-binding protein [Selenihalanaerobacter shriftii]
MIKIKGLSKVYSSEEGQVVALKNVNFEIKSGDIFGIIGPSGAGKSSFIRCLNLLEEPTEGQVIVNGQDLTKLNTKELRQARKKIGMIFQGFNLLQSRTVADNVAFPLELAGVSKSDIKNKVNELLDLVGLADKANNYPAQLSGGQQQRVGVARALANEPKLLLCDEATSSLDPETTDSILDLLKDINEKLGITIVLITHEMEVIKQICDRVAVLEKGYIIEEGETIQVFTDPKHETTKRFVQSVINADIPEEFYQRSSVLESKSGKLIKVSFVGEVVKEPTFSTIIKEFDIDANILYGNIDKIQETSFGILLIELTGNNFQIKQAVNYLHEEGLQVEVVRSDESVRAIS